MNFMSSRSRSGFYEDGSGSGGFSKGTRPMSQLPSSSSSSSTCSKQKGLVPFTYNHQQKPGWMDNNEDQDDDNATLRCYLGGVSEQPELMMESSSPSNPTRGGGDESSDGLGGRGGGLGVGLCVGRSAELQMIEKEHMFDKVVTPSDVGKLNRLVIPKQHAEKYFPLDSSTNEKGLLLNFEDSNGKPWRFRYSYWNSSQSYVMTKGWSRFVKEKKLDAGDIVSFHRGVGEFAKDRLFIDWRRRPDAPHELPPPISVFSLPNHFTFRPGNHHHHYPFFLPSQPRNRHLHLLQPNAISHQPHLNSGYTYGSNSSNLYGSGSVFYLKSAGVGGAGGSPVPQVGMVQLQRGGGVGVEGMPVHPMVFESVPVVQGKAAAKRLRLFGVNMECPIPESDESCDILSSTTVNHSTIAPQLPHLSSSSSPYPPPPSRPYSANDVHDKGKASMSLDLDI